MVCFASITHLMQDEARWSFFQGIYRHMLRCIHTHTHAHTHKYIIYKYVNNVYSNKYINNMYI